jgi:hypothetical protein
VGPRANLDAVEKVLLPLLGIEPRFLGSPSRSLVAVLTELCNSPCLRSVILMDTYM